MSIPDYQTFFKPLLDFASDGKEHSTKEVRTKFKILFKLSDDDLKEMLSSGSNRFSNRVSWAKSYLIKAKCLKPTKRGCFIITKRGKELLKQGHDRIDGKVLKQYPEFVEFQNPAKMAEVSQTEISLNDITDTPEEILHNAFNNIQQELANDLLHRVIENSPIFFEKLVIDLMLAMGYGGSHIDAAKHIGKSGDEGIDGIINEDRLGLDVIYLQAKRWQGSVGRPEVQKFVGALHGKRAKKGVFITTGKFSKEAYKYVQNIEPKVILIDGIALANYMIVFNVATSVSATYEIKKIDMDYFSEE